MIKYKEQEGLSGREQIVNITLGEFYGRTPAENVARCLARVRVDEIEFQSIANHLGLSEITVNEVLNAFRDLERGLFK